VLLFPLALILASPGESETLSAKIEREYIQPVFQQIRSALHGRESNWTPPILPGSAPAAKLGKRIRALWLEPLMAADQNYALGAAHSLASPQASTPPAEPDFASILPASMEGLVPAVARRFLSRFFPEERALNAASGPAPANSARQFADSTRLARGSGGTSQRLKLKSFRSRLSSTP
jgi:hypothetical protein